jgi:hypothetical protein
VGCTNVYCVNSVPEPQRSTIGFPEYGDATSTKNGVVLVFVGPQQRLNKMQCFVSISNRYIQYINALFHFNIYCNLMKFEAQDRKAVPV